MTTILLMVHREIITVWSEICKRLMPNLYSLPGKRVIYPQPGSRSKWHTATPIKASYTEANGWLQAGWSWDRITVGARFSTPVQTGPGDHPASCTMGTGSFSGVKCSWGVTLTPHLLLVPWSRKSRAIPLLPLWAVRPVQSLSARTRVHFILRLRYIILPVHCLSCFKQWKNW